RARVRYGQVSASGGPCDPHGRALAVRHANGGSRSASPEDRQALESPESHGARTDGQREPGQLLAALVAALAVSPCAATKYSLTPIDPGAAQLSYYNGRPTADLELRNGAVQVTPLGVEVNGRISFAVAAYNKLDVTSNLGPENFRARVGGV